MYYTEIHDMVRKAAAAEGVSIKTLIEDHGIVETTYYKHLREGTPWRGQDIKPLSDITGKTPAEILDSIL